jgi:hypothetical protein
MQARAWCQASFAATSLVCLVGAPAHADWGGFAAHPVLSMFARQAARQAIMYEIRRINSPAHAANSAARSGSTQSHTYGARQPYRAPSRSYAGSAGNGSSSGYRSASQDSHSGLRYPTDEKFVPPPPPTPVLYPTSPLASETKSKSPPGASPLVPPPPPAPSVWEDAPDVTPVVNRQ